MSLPKDLVVRTIEMHTGSSIRTVVSGFPPTIGSTVLEKIRYARDHLQHVRDFLTLEPRGHHDMFGAVIVETDHPEADIGVIFMNSGNYFNMCGHMLFGVARYAVDHGYTKQMSEPETPVNVEVPCGLVRAFVETKDGKAGPRVRFHSVPVFAAKLDLEVDVEGVGKMKVDISYGGMFFAICDAKKLGLDIHTCGADALAATSDRVIAAVRKVYTPTHPDHPDLAYLQGTLLTDGGDGADAPTVHVQVSTYKQVARSACGSGTSARLAAIYARDQIKLGQKRTFQSGITGTTFTGMPHKETTCGQYSAIVVELSTCAYYTGNCEFTLEDADPLKGGFRVKRESS